MKPSNTAHGPSYHSEMHPNLPAVNSLHSKETSSCTSENDSSITTSDIRSGRNVIIDEEALPGVRQAEAITRVWNKNTLFVAYAWSVTVRTFILDTANSY